MSLIVVSPMADATPNYEQCSPHASSDGNDRDDLNDDD